MQSVSTSNRINCLLIGEVSSGKSTLLNSMYIKTFSDMKRIRTTMSVNIYYETNDKNELKKADDIFEQNKKYEEDMKNKQITELTENVYKVKPSVSFGDVLSKFGYFMNIIDIPGLNDGNCNTTIYKWLDNNFKYIDIVLFLINGENALNTESERNLLKYIIKQTSQYDHIKLINIINKFDEPDDEELIELKEQAEKVIVEQLKDTSLEKIIVPISAVRAYLYRYIEHNKSLDGLIAKHKSLLAQLELGNKAKRYADDKLLDELTKSIKDSKHDETSPYNNTNYHELIKVFKDVVIADIKSIYCKKVINNIRDSIPSGKETKPLEYALDKLNSIYNVDIQLKSNYLMTLIKDYFGTLNVTANSMKTMMEDVGKLMLNYIYVIHKFANVTIVEELLVSFYVTCLNLTSNAEDLLVWFNNINGCKITKKAKVIEMITIYFEDKHTYATKTQLITNNKLLNIYRADSPGKHLNSYKTVQHIINTLPVDCSQLLDNYLSYFCDHNYHGSGHIQVGNISDNINSLVYVALNEAVKEFPHFRKYFPNSYKYIYIYKSEACVGELLNKLDFSRSVIDQTLYFIRDFYEYCNKKEKSDSDKKKLDDEVSIEEWVNSVKPADKTPPKSSTKKQLVQIEPWETSKYNDKVTGKDSKRKKHYPEY